MMFLPKNTTSYLQPLNMGIIANIKGYYKDNLKQFLMDKICFVDMDLKKAYLEANLFTVLIMENVKQSTYINCWNKSCLTLDNADEMWEKLNKSNNLDNDALDIIHNSTEDESLEEENCDSFDSLEKTTFMPKQTSKISLINSLYSISEAQLQLGDINLDLGGKLEEINKEIVQLINKSR